LKKPHLYFRNPLEGVEKYRSRSRFPGAEEEIEEDKQKNYSPKRKEWIKDLGNYYFLKSQKERRRNKEIKIPAEIDYLILEFFDYFDAPEFETQYIRDFGLESVHYEKFNTVGYFAVINKDNFQNFINELNKFIHEEINYNPNIKFIKNFDFLSYDKILKLTEFRENFILNLFIPLYLYDNSVRPILKVLESYLIENSVDYSIDINNDRIELYNCNLNQVKEIVDNFDIIHSVNSPLAGIIRPSAFNQPIREYGFSISNSSEELPVIAIMDSGISSRTPLAPILINQENEFDITHTSPFRDSADHGTGVAALAALGRSLYPNHTGNFNADAKLLSIKLISESEGFISQKKVEELIREAHNKYGIKLFVLTVGYSVPLHNCEQVSNYALLLDKLSYELDILIFISTGNAHGLNFCMVNPLSKEVKPYPSQFDNPDYNICPPSESYNNITCGAIADNFEDYHINCYSTDKNFPASYTRKFNIPANHEFRKKRRISNQLVKPDIVCAGGDSTRDLEIKESGLKYLSAIDGHYFDKWIGTSYSAPLAANIAAKLIKEYPALSNNLQTVKALLINSSRIPGSGDSFKSLRETRLMDLVGKGNPNEFYCLYSDENNITMILEDSILPNNVKAYPVQLPTYLNTLIKNKSLVEVNATLCYKFNPVTNNQICYLPVHISFGIFKNKPLIEKGIDKKGKAVDIGINNNKTENIMIRESWSEDYYYKAKMLSNCHKQRFFIARDNLISERNIFKITIKCKLHKLLPTNIKDNYNIEHPFSLVISFRENLNEIDLTNQLYNEMILINKLEAIAELHAEAELENNI
jgi:hypothetical protein